MLRTFARITSNRLKPPHAFVATWQDVLSSLARVLYFAAMAGNKNPTFRERQLPTYPIGLIVRVLLWSGRQVEAKIIRIETTALGTFLHVEFGDEVANVTFKQVVGFYDFCYLKERRKVM